MAYRLQEAAEIASRSTKTIVRWCNRGLLPNASKVPGPKGLEWSIPAADLDRVLHEKGLTPSTRGAQVAASTVRTSEIGDAPEPDAGSVDDDRTPDGRTEFSLILQTITEMSRQQQDIVRNVEGIRVQLDELRSAIGTTSGIEEIWERLRQLESAIAKLTPEHTRAGPTSFPVPDRAPDSPTAAHRARRAQRISDLNRRHVRHE